MSSSSGTSTYRWRQRVAGHLRLARISNSPTVISNTLAGAALAGALQPAGMVVFLVAVAMLLFYTAGMYLNDLCDYRVDLRERPERPLPSGAVSRSEASLAVLLLFTLGAALLLVAGAAPFASGLVLIGLIVLYDLWHKANPLSPLLMASTRAMVYITAFLAVSAGPGSSPAVRSLAAEASADGASWLTLAIWTVLLALYIVALTQLAKAEGRRGALRFWPAAALFLPGAYFALQVPEAPGVLLLLAFAGWVAYSLSFVYAAGRRSFPKAIAFLIAGVALLDALVLSAAGSSVGVAIALAAFALTLLAQRHVRGT
jgi:4-hydroxybenzoate polyprenyltransferase